VSFSEDALRILTVVPGNVLPPNFWVWTYFTHCFIEMHFWMLICDLGVIVLYGKLLEPLWGALEMLIFFLVINILVAVLSAITYMLVYLISQDTDYLFETHIHGLAGYLAGFSVATKQVMPDHILVNSPFGKLRNKHIPLWLLVAAFLAHIAGAVDGPFPIMFGWGLLISWIYLRFYQKHSSGNRGDMADSFTFARCCAPSLCNYNQLNALSLQFLSRPVPAVHLDHLQCHLHSFRSS
jgi:membrane associated rhomboid family serine protease